MDLVIIEKAGTQRFMFGSNKQREAIGASQLTAGLADVVRHMRPTALPVQVISGSAIVLLPGPESLGDARALVAAVTEQCLDTGYGLDLVASIIYVDDAEVASPRGQQSILDRAHAAQAAQQSAQASAALRWPQIPHARVCRTTGLPATWPPPAEERNEVLSASAIGKRSQAPVARSRMLDILRDGGIGPEDRERLFPNLARLEEALGQEGDELAWVGVMHADTNGLGAAQRELAGRVRDDYAAVSPDGQRLLHHDSKLSVFAFAADVGYEMERCTQKAYVEATRAVLRRPAVAAATIVPVVPIVLGGDDVTVLLKDDIALPFAAAYLRALAAATAASTTLQQLSRTGLTAAAGVAMVKRTFPFSSACVLAEDLVRSAKETSRSANLLDLHVLYDSQVSDLDQLRAQLRLSNGTLLTARPYTADSSAAPDLPRWDDLEGLVARVNETVDGERVIPRSVAMAWWRGLQQDPGAAERINGELWARGPDLAPLVRRAHGREALLLWDALNVSKFLAA